MADDGNEAADSRAGRYDVVSLRECIEENKRGG